MKQSNIKNNCYFCETAAAVFSSSVQEICEWTIRGLFCHVIDIHVCKIKKREPFFLISFFLSLSHHIHTHTHTHTHTYTQTHTHSQSMLDNYK